MRTNEERHKFRRVKFLTLFFILTPEAALFATEDTIYVWNAAFLAYVQAH